MISGRSFGMSSTPWFVEKGRLRVSGWKRAGQPGIMAHGFVRQLRRSRPSGPPAEPLERSVCK